VSGLAQREAEEFIAGKRRQVSPAAARIIEEKRRHELRKVYGTSFYESGPLRPEDIQNED
jgi:hypothetical protein